MAGGLTVVQQKEQTIKGYLMSDATMDQIKMALPAIGITPQRIARVAFTAITQNPKLSACGLPSLLRAVILSAQYGVLPDGRQAHLIPYGPDCQFIMDYKGLITLIRRSPKVASYHLDAVYENDEIEIISGSKREINHIPCIHGSRGEFLLVYSLITYENGEIDFDYMTREECEKTRDDYSKKDREGQFSPAWRKSFVEMCKKTVCHRHGKKADISPEAASAIIADEMAESGKSQAGIMGMNDAIFGSGDLDIIDTAAEEVDEESEVDLKAAQTEYNKAVKKHWKNGKVPKEKLEEYIQLLQDKNEKSRTETLNYITGNIEAFIPSFAKWAGLEVKEPPKQETKDTGGGGNNETATDEQPQQEAATTTEEQQSPPPSSEIDPPETISNEEHGALVAQIREIEGYDTVRFCADYRIGDVRELPKETYQMALMLLVDMKIAQKPKGGSQKTGKTIDEPAATSLLSMMFGLKGYSAKDFTKNYGVPDVGKLPASRYIEAREFLQEKINKQAEEEESGEVPDTIFE